MKRVMVPTKRIQVRCEPVLEERVVELLEETGVDRILVMNGVLRESEASGMGVTNELVVLDFFADETVLGDVCTRLGKPEWRSYDITITVADVLVARHGRRQSP